MAAEHAWHVELAFPPEPRPNLALVCRRMSCAECDRGLPGLVVQIEYPETDPPHGIFICQTCYADLRAELRAKADGSLPF